MICFGDVARQIVGKPVQQLLRAATAASQLPAEIARIVSRRFTFAVTLTQQSYYRENKTYQVNSVVTTHVQHEPAAPVPQPTAPGSPATPIASGAGDSSLSVRAATDFTPPSSFVTKAEHSLVLTDQTPPPKLHDDDTSQLNSREKSGKGDRSSARKRLIYSSSDDKALYGSLDKQDTEAAPDETGLAKSNVLVADGSPLDDTPGEKKRQRSARVAGQRAG